MGFYFYFLLPTDFFEVLEVGRKIKKDNIVWLDYIGKNPSPTSDR